MYQKQHQSWFKYMVSMWFEEIFTLWELNQFSLPFSAQLQNVLLFSHSMTEEIHAFSVRLRFIYASDASVFL